VENRSRPTQFRGRFALHVSLRRAEWLPEVNVEAIPSRTRKAIGAAWESNTSAGRVIGTVELVDCVRNSGSIWADDDQWHWILRDPRPYVRPMPAKGQLGLWEWAR
jgi:hypothetical protein